MGGENAKVAKVTAVKETWNFSREFFIPKRPHGNSTEPSLIGATICPSPEAELKTFAKPKLSANREMGKSAGREKG